MAEWDALPPELLAQIAERLQSGFDRVRFRSVCSSWRRSCLPLKPSPVCNSFPPEVRGRFDYSFNLRRRTIFLVRLRQVHAQAPHSWLIKTTENFYGKKRLLDPLSDSESKFGHPSPVHVGYRMRSPKVLELMNVQVIELGHECVGKYSVYIDHSLEPQLREYKRRVALMSTQGNKNIMLAVHFHGDLALLRWGDKEWTILNNTSGVQDITSFNGKFYAVDQQGRTITVAPSSEVSFLPSIVSLTRHNKEFLVESAGDLLLVEMFLLRPPSAGAETFHYRNVGDEAVGFRIFKLDEEWQRWEEVKDLGNYVLFLGRYSNFSVSASEFSWSEGNLIFYRTDICFKGSYYFYDGETEEFSGCGNNVIVFQLGKGRVGYLKDCPDYLELFCQCPDWITFSEAEVGCNFPGSVASSYDSEFSIEEAQTEDEFPSPLTLPPTVVIPGTESGTESSDRVQPNGGHKSPASPTGQDADRKSGSFSSKFRSKVCCF